MKRRAPEITALLKPRTRALSNPRLAPHSPYCRPCSGRPFFSTPVFFSIASPWMRASQVGQIVRRAGLPQTMHGRSEGCDFLISVIESRPPRLPAVPREERTITCWGRM